MGHHLRASSSAKPGHSAVLRPTLTEEAWPGGVGTLVPGRCSLGLEQTSFLKAANDQNETHPEQSRRGRQLTLGRRDPKGQRDRCHPPGGERGPPRWAREPEQQPQNKTQTLTNTHTRPLTEVTTPQTPKWKQSSLNRLLLKMRGVLKNPPTTVRAHRQINKCKQ